MRPATTGEHVVVETNAGAVRGFWRTDSAAFLGIPFAEPPYGDLRFLAPVQVKSWAGFGTHSATGRRRNARRSQRSPPSRSRAFPAKTSSTSMSSPPAHEPQLGPKHRSPCWFTFTGAVMSRDHLPALGMTAWRSIATASLRSPCPIGLASMALVGCPMRRPIAGSSTGCLRWSGCGQHQPVRRGSGASNNRRPVCRRWRGDDAVGHASSTRPFAAAASISGVPSDIPLERAKQTTARLAERPGCFA